VVAREEPVVRAVAWRKYAHRAPACRLGTLGEPRTTPTGSGKADNPRARTTEDEGTVQGNYGHGWEDLTAESTWGEIKQRLREYQENEPGTAFRAIKRRVKISPKDNPQPWARVFG
jgi:hypothetical protein